MLAAPLGGFLLRLLTAGLDVRLRSDLPPYVWSLFVALVGAVLVVLLIRAVEVGTLGGGGRRRDVGSAAGLGNGFDNLWLRPVAGRVIRFRPLIGLVDQVDYWPVDGDEVGL